MSNIKINDVPQRIQYAATLGQTQFSIPFPFFDNAYVSVWSDGILIAQGAAPGQYGITGAGSPSGGQITLVTAALLDQIITIEGFMPIDRTSIYSATISNLTGSDLNGDFNREVVMLQQLSTVQQYLQLQYPPWALVSQDLTVTRDRYLPILAPQEVWRMSEDGTHFEGFEIDSSPAPSNSPYVTYTEDPTLESPQNLGLLASGILKNTVTSAVAVISPAVNAVDYWAPNDVIILPGLPTNPNDAASKQYVDSISGGFSLVLPVRVATTTNFVSTYANGASGVGATLTATSNGVATIDGVVLSLADRVLFKNQTTTFQNGIYAVSDIGSVSTPAIYTRTSDFDTPAEIVPGVLVPVTSGTANINTLWLQTSTVVAVGTTAIIFIQYGIVASDIVTISGIQTITGNKTFSGTVVVQTPTLSTQAATKGYVDAASAFPSGTRMLFAQTAAPTGWTKDTTAALNDTALRLVTGTVTSGGTVAFTTAFASQAVAGTNAGFTLTAGEIPGHQHSDSFGTGGATGSGASVTRGASTGSTGPIGGGGSHTHTFTGTAINLAVKYNDVIVASKD